MDSDISEVGAVYSVLWPATRLGSLYKSGTDALNYIDSRSRRKRSTHSVNGSRVHLTATVRRITLVIYNR